METGAESDQEYVALTSITVLVRTVCRRARGPCFPSSLRDARSASTFHLGGLAERDADEPLRLTKPQGRSQAELARLLPPRPKDAQHCVNGHGGCPRGGLMELELRRWTNTVGAAADTARRAARPCPRQGACRLVRGCHRDRAGRGAALLPLRIPRPCPPPHTATSAPCRAPSKQLPESRGSALLRRWPHTPQGHSQW